MVGEVPWQVDPRTGEHWPMVSDMETSEEEVEGAVRGEEVGEPMRGVEIEEPIGGVEVDVDPLSAARDLIRVEVRRTCSFHVRLSNVRIQESQPTCPPNTPHSQITHASQSAGQPQMQQLQELSITPNQVVSNLRDEGFQEPLGTGQTQTIPPQSTHPHSPGSSRGISPVAQPPPSHDTAVTGIAGGSQPTLSERNETRSPGRSLSVTPTPGNQRNTDTTTPLNTTTPSPRDLRGGVAEPPRHGKGKRLEPYSDEEEVVDIPMEDRNDFTPHQQQYGGVCFISHPTFSCTHSLVEPASN